MTGEFWKWLHEHPIDVFFAIALAIVFAIFFGFLIAVFFEAFSFGSKIRSRLRLMVNKAAERSVSKLQRRIGRQQDYRDSISSDRGLYIILLRMALLVLFMLTFTGALIVIAHGSLFATSLPQQSVSTIDGLALVYFVLAMLAAFVGIRHARLDTREKVAELIAKLDEEIESMKHRLTLLNERKPKLPSKEHEG